MIILLLNIIHSTWHDQNNDNNSNNNNKSHRSIQSRKVQLILNQIDVYPVAAVTDYLLTLNQRVCAA